MKSKNIGGEGIRKKYKWDRNLNSPGERRIHAELQERQQHRASCWLGDEPWQRGLWATKTQTKKSQHTKWGQESGFLKR